MTSTEQSEAELLRRLKQGDNDAWTELTRHLSPRLFRYLRHSLPSTVDAEDALSETMIAAVHAVPTFDGRVSLAAFIFSLAYRKVADFWRQRPPTTELPSSLSAPVAGTERIELEEWLNRLPEHSKQVLILRYYVGLSVAEIADVIDRSYKGTESLLSRARGQLREIMDEAKSSND